MKIKIFSTLFLVFFLFASSFAAEVTWHNNLDDAKKVAQEDDKIILVNFSGSNWCYWCKKLAAEVFGKNEFQNYAKDNLVLMVADFPRPNNLPASVQEQNNSLAQKYGIRGFPTIILLNAEGEMIGKTGYQEGGPVNYVNHLKQILNQKKE